MAGHHKQILSPCQQGAGREAGGVNSTMAYCLKQLLEFDDGNRRATLESLSRYVAEKTEKTGECSSTEAPSNSNESGESSGSESSHTKEALRVSGPPGPGLPTAKRISTSRAAAAGIPGSKPSNTEETVHVSGPPGLGSTNKEINTPQAAAARKVSMEPPPGLENLKPSSAALYRPNAHCESAVKRVSGLGHQKSAPLDSKVATPTAAPKVEDKADSLFALRKAFSGLTMDLPKEFASLAQDIISSSAEQGNVNVQRTKQSMETLRWLRYYLEQQQTDSMQKILGLMHLQGHVGLESCLPGTQHAGQWTHGLGQGQTFPGPGNLWIPPTFCPGSFPSTWGGAPASYFGAQAPGCTQNGFAIQRNHLNETSASKAARTNAGQRKTKTGTQPTTGLKEESLRAHLRELQDIDCNRIILVRKINRLGFEAPGILQQHYSQFGKIDRVLVAHSLVKAQDRRQLPRMRPSGLGFIVMSTTEEAQAILDLGEHQFVMNAQIRVRQFERRLVAQEETEQGEDL